ncbi:hypothetical protein SAMD00019534_042370, partial [Acytostelium subglobosum LB1]|uniref:hypothetical protein n=1 Tax=Acytostelium subglobosum LB1 TaxID=1410327 RepID=UPI000644A092
SIIINLSNNNMMERLKSSAEKLSSSDASIQENCLRYLINGSADSSIQVLLFSMVGPKQLKQLIHSSNEVIQMLSTWLLSHLCLNSDNCAKVFKSDLLQSVMELLSSENQDIAEKALWVLTNLSLCPEHTSLLAEHGVVETLISFIKRNNHTLIILSAVPLRNLLHKDTCNDYLDHQKAVCHSGAIQNITSILSCQYSALPKELIQSLISIIHVLSIYHLVPNQTALIRRIIAISGVLGHLTSFLSSPTTPLTIKEQVVSILINLSLTEETERPILDSGAITPLIECAVSMSSPISIKALSISCLANLSSNPEIRTVLHSKLLVEGLCELLKEDEIRTNPQFIIAISLLTANMCIDGMFPINLNQSNQMLEDENTSFRRGKIIKEIIDTEQAFIYSINVCIRVYYNPLVVAPSSPPILHKDLVDNIFTNIDKVFRVNCEFLKKLRSIPEGDVMEVASSFQWLWDQHATIPEYRHYINGFNRAMDLIHENRAKIPRFKEFLDKCQFSDQCKSETLESYLIRPIQRIPRYILLLTDLLSHTSDPMERSAINDSLRRTKTVVDLLNESKRSAENLAKAHQLQDKVMGLQDGFQLHNGARQLLREGLMMEFNKNKKVSQYRYILLFNDYLYITKQKKRKYYVKKTVPLLEVKVVDVPDNQLDIENSFRIFWSNREMDRNENGAVLCSSKPEEKEEWIKEIREASNEMKRANLQKMLHRSQSPKTTRSSKGKLH